MSQWFRNKQFACVKTGDFWENSSDYNEIFSRVPYEEMFEV